MRCADADYTFPASWMSGDHGRTGAASEMLTFKQIVKKPISVPNATADLGIVATITKTPFFEPQALLLVAILVSHEQSHLKLLAVCSP